MCSFRKEFFMDILLGTAMFCIPPLFALVIHNYLRHGEMTGKRKVIFYAHILSSSICFRSAYRTCAV